MRERNYRKYDDAFREGAVELAKRSDRTLAEIASDLGMPAPTLRYWYHFEMAKKRKLPLPKGKRSAAEMAPAEAGSDKERIAQLERELDALRKENDELKMDRAILKKAAAFFAKESE